jgi:hypothetical protein
MPRVSRPVDIVTDGAILALAAADFDRQVQSHAGARRQLTFKPFIYSRH